MPTNTILTIATIIKTAPNAHPTNYSNLSGAIVYLWPEHSYFFNEKWWLLPSASPWLFWAQSQRATELSSHIQGQCRSPEATSINQTNQSTSNLSLEIVSCMVSYNEPLCAGKVRGVLVGHDSVAGSFNRRICPDHLTWPLFLSPDTASLHLLGSLVIRRPSNIPGRDSLLSWQFKKN